MDYGFGTGPFGSGPFGRADYAREGVWERSVPKRNKKEDTGDLEQTLMAVVDALDPRIKLIDDLPLQRSPIYARSGIENAEALTIESLTIKDDSTVELLVSEDDIEALEGIYARSQREDGTWRDDGWMAVIGEFLEPVVSVNAFDRTIDILTSKDINSLVGIAGGLEVRPPDLLVQIGNTVGVLVDRQDPPDFTRRALYRHHLIRDLKVSKRLFSLLGRIYGFRVDVSGLYCIDGAIKDDLIQSSPDKVIELPGGSGNYYTTLAPYGHFFDDIPADYIPADSSGDLSFDVTLDAVADAGPGVVDGVTYWRVDLTVDSGPSTDPTNYINSFGHWKIRDPDGREFWLEDFVAGPAGGYFFYSDEEPVPVEPEDAANGESWEIVLPQRLQCREHWRPASAYLIEAKPEEVLTEPLASTDNLFDRIEEKMETYVPYHIRVMGLNLSRDITVESSYLEGISLSTDTAVEEDLYVSDIYGSTYDSTAADVQPADSNVLVVTSEFIVEP